MSDIKEQKYSLIKSSVDLFTTMLNELKSDMYSWLVAIVDELIALGLTKLIDKDVTRKFIKLLPKENYATIIPGLLSFQGHKQDEANKSLEQDYCSKEILQHQIKKLAHKVMRRRFHIKQHG
jgi:hypothetical protein